MANRQTPFSQLLPPLPEGFQEPFWYASLQSFWLYYRVDPDVLRRKLPPLPEGAGLEVALFDFGDGDHAGLASVDLQRYTGHGPTYLETTDEVEFNIYVYPEARLPDVPLMTWQDYLLGAEQTKTIGGYRLHVPCDNQIAVLAGQELYGEPKYLAVFDCAVPSLNGSPSSPSTWTYHVYQDLGGPPDPSKPHTPVKGPLIYGLECHLGSVLPVPANPSPLIEYGVLDASGTRRLIANYWDFYGPFETYMLDALDPPWRSEITFGTEPDRTRTLDDLRLLIGDAQPIAAQIFTSPPVSAESRGWYQMPTAARPARDEPGRTEQRPVNSFVSLSAALTGFRAAELWGTGQAETYLNELLETVGEPIVARLLATGDEALNADDAQSALREQVMDDRDLGPVARNVIILWYLGQWNALPNEWRNRHGASPRDQPRVVSADAYQSGLAWRAIGAHPMGAKPPGYGSWADPPSVPNS
jgi:hypothetical protein